MLHKLKNNYRRRSGSTLPLILSLFHALQIMITLPTETYLSDFVPIQAKTLIENSPNEYVTTRL